MADHLERYGKRLIDLGYNIVPIKAGYKFPKGLKNWQDIKADAPRVDKWLANGFADGGVGIICGDVIAIDLDIRNEQVAEELVDYIYFNLAENAPQRIGQAPKSLFVFRTDKPFAKVQSATYVSPNGNEHKVECLGKGQQFVSHAVHPDTKAPYKWLNANLAELAFDDLPLITAEDAQALVAYFEDNLPEDWKPKLSSKSKSSQNIDFSLPEDIRVLEHYKPPLADIDTKRAKRAIDLLPEYSEEYDTWVKVGMALHHQFAGGADGFGLWDEWSQQSVKYDGESMLSKWRSFQANLANTNPVTFASIVSEAKKVHDAKVRAKKLAEGGLPFLNLADLEASLKPIDWVVDGFLERNTVGLVVGDPQAYKTFLALDWALHIATGKEWHGHAVKQAPVMYISGEGHNGFARRVKAWVDTHGAPVDAPFRLAKGAVKLGDKESAVALVKLIDDEVSRLPTTPGVFFIDTLARNFGDGDENSAGDVTKFIENIEIYLRERYDATVVIVHHSGHGAKNRGRGSSAITGAADFEYLLAREDQPGSMRTVLMGLKMKDAALQPPTWFEGREVAFTLSDGSEAQSLVLDKIDTPAVSEVAPLKGRQLEVWNVLQGMGGTVDRDALREACVNDGVCEDFAKFRDTIRQLKKKEFIYEHGDNITDDPAVFDFGDIAD